MHSDWLAALVNELGIPTTTGRTSAIRQHVLDMPAPVVALGYHQVAATRTATQAAQPGAATPPVITHGHSHRELATLEYATFPV
jgi:malonyl CoA-acyl carrier protein transacylase